MTRLSVAIALATLGLILPGTSESRQAKTIPGDTKTVTGKVEKIDTAARTLTITTGKEHEEIQVPETVKGFANVKVGDSLTLRYYDNIVLRLKPSDEPDFDKSTPGGISFQAAIPGQVGTASSQRTITAKITAIDEKVPSITFTGPNDWLFTSPVQDRKALSKVKVGDKVDIVWTAAVLVSLEPAQ
jgi:hypothetical protein